MGQLSPWHLLILAAVFILLFGARKLPDTARALGRSMRILRSETRDLYGADDVIDPPQQLTADGQTPGTTAKPIPEAQQARQ